MFSKFDGSPRSSACDLRFVRSISEMWRSAPGIEILRGTQRYVWQPLFDDAVKIHHRHAVAHMLHHRQGTHLRYHESIGTLTPPAIYFGRGQTILLEGERIKYDTIKTRCLQHRGKAA